MEIKDRQEWPADATTPTTYHVSNSSVPVVVEGEAVGLILMTEEVVEGKAMMIGSAPGLLRLAALLLASLEARGVRAEAVMGYYVMAVRNKMDVSAEGMLLAANGLPDFPDGDEMAGLYGDDPSLN